MSKPSPLMFERVRLQAHLRTLIQTLGEDQALAIIGTALEKELKYVDFARDVERVKSLRAQHTTDP